jgi:hypothetical protein
MLVVLPGTTFLEQFDVVLPFDLDFWHWAVGFFLLCELQDFLHCGRVHELEEFEEGHVAATEFVRQRNHSLLERKRHVFDEQHATWDRLALDLRPVLQVLFLLLLSCFRLLGFGRFVRLSWPLHCRTPSLLLLGIPLRKLFFASYVW